MRVWLFSLFIVFTGYLKLLTRTQERTQLAIADASLPLYLSKIDNIDSLTPINLNDGINARIYSVTKDFCDSEQVSDGAVSYNQSYIKTLRLAAGSATVFMVLLRYPATGEVHSKLLFYDNQTKDFIGDPMDFKLYALYDYEKGKLVPANLKKLFAIETPEIDTVDYNNDGIADYKLTRLWHNGTFNAIHETILSVANGKIDTLHFEEKAKF